MEAYLHDVPNTIVQVLCYDITQRGNQSAIIAHAFSPKMQDAMRMRSTNPHTLGMSPVNLPPVSHTHHIA